MKRLLLSLGLSVTILLSASFAQPAVKRIATADTKVQQDKQALNPKIAAKLGLHAFKKHAPAPFQARKSALKHVATYASQDPEKAKIKLIVGDCWEDGSGYQLLLDSDARLCDGLEEEGFDQSKIDDYYAMADVKLPANASPVVGTTSVLDFKSDSVEIAPGVYDVLVVNPSESEDEDIYVYIAGGTSTLDDFEFVKGYTYIFEIELVEDYGDYYDNCIFHTPFELAVTFNPVLSCEVGTEVDIKLTVTNNGNADVENFEIWYYVADEADADFEPDVVKQTIAAKLEAGKTETYTFTTKVENIRKDSLYVIYAGVTPLAGELDTTNNKVAGSFMKQDGLTELPYEFDLDAYGFIPAASGVWEIEDGVAEASETGVPLISRCFDLKGGSIYRLSYEYTAGFNLFGIFQITEDYHIGFGLASEPLSTWNTVFEEEEVFAEDWTLNEILLKPETDGTYALYFSADYIGLMSLREISIREVAAKDARLNSFDAGLARLIPVKQVNGNITATATVQNRGSETMAVATVEVKMNGTVMGNAEVKDLEPESVVEVEIPLTISGLKTGDKAAFVVAVALEGEAEADQKDNTLNWEMEVNDYVMAYDHVTDDMYVIDNAIGLEDYSNVGFGLVFSLNAKDTLTDISLGWCEYENMMVGIRIQEWKKASRSLGKVIYETEVRRGTAAGQVEYKMPSIIMEAGDYMISMIELSASASGIIVDGEPNGGFYLIDGNVAEYVDEVGTPAIRAIFGPDAAPMAKDAVVSEITQPKETGRFAANQEVVAKILNQGYEAVTVPVSLWVNGNPVANKQVAVGAYGKTEVTFIADLSSPNTEYVLKVLAALEGDEDPTNDTCIKTVRSLAPANPYVMNFEDCEDFAISGEFNPAWTSVDLSGAAYSYGFNVDYPHCQEIVGFMAAPSSWEEDASGERFGIVFGVGDENNGPVESNAWLISPKLSLTANNAKLSFSVKSATDEYDLEKYNVWVSTTDNKPESFVQVGKTQEAPAEWTSVNVDLAEYAGKDVHIAIQCVSYDAFAFMIDDIVVGNVGNEGAARLESCLSVYPNPAREMITLYAKDAVINHVDIFNIAGLMVHQSNALNTTEYRYSVKGLDAGMYFARVKTAQGTAILKFIVK